MSNHLSRPAALIVVEHMPRPTDRPLRPDVVYAWAGQRWRLEPVGCVLCVEDDREATFSSVDDDGPTRFACTSHGELREVPYEMRKVYRISLGGVEREGEESLTDTMLFPAELTLDQQTALVERLLDESQAEEVAANVVPND